MLPGLKFRTPEFMGGLVYWVGGVYDLPLEPVDLFREEVALDCLCTWFWLWLGW